MNKEACENEKIRIPGSIQPHGSLAAYDILTGQLLHYSENLSSELENLRAHDFGKIERIDPNYRMFTVDNVRVLESENSPSLDESIFRVDSTLLLSRLEAISNSLSIEDLFARAVKQTRQLTSFDRVMIYKFDQDWNGSVISEAKAPELEPFLGLNFPATDIPAQARDLYLTSWLRLIPDVTYKPIPIINIGTSEALDLSRSRFRSVSPIHLQYLKNMGVGASMSISIIENGRLWGLIACHHRSTKILSQNLLDECEVLGRFISLQIAVKEKSELVSYRQTKRSISEKIESSLFVEKKGLEDAFEARLFATNGLLDLVPASGVAYLGKGNVWTCGVCPNANDVTKVADLLNKNARGSPLFQTEKLGHNFPELIYLSAVGSGILSIRIPDITPSYIIWFRAEKKETVRWAGDPSKNQRDPLTPRNSFAEWSEVVSGKSEVWQKFEIEAANDFLQTVIRNNLLRQITLEKRARNEAEESNRELDFFSYIVAHDLKEPLRGIKHFANFVKEDEGGKISTDSLENLTQILKLSQRVDLILDSLFKYSRLGMTKLGKSEVDMNLELHQLITSMKHSIEIKNASVKIISHLPSVKCDRVRIIEVFQNLISNSLKYNRNVRPEILISCQEHDGVQEFRVSDNGIGIDKAEIPRIFDSFIRLADAHQFGDGTGMGLSIVKRIIEKHEGVISVESEKGRGTSFRFTLPRGKEETDEQNG